MIILSGDIDVKARNGFNSVKIRRAIAYRLCIVNFYSTGMIFFLFLFN